MRNESICPYKGLYTNVHSSLTFKKNMCLTILSLSCGMQDLCCIIWDLSLRCTDCLIVTCGFQRTQVQ